MQPYTGETFVLPESGLPAEAHVGSTFTARELEAFREKINEREERSGTTGEVVPANDLDAAIRSARAHGPLIGVSADVAHAQRLGQRELDRRARRRKAAKQARKTNR